MRNRRNFIRKASMLGAIASSEAMDGTKPEQETGSITDVGGLRVGHFTHSGRPTGCTVVLFDNPAMHLGRRRIIRIQVARERMSDEPPEPAAYRTRPKAGTHAGIIFTPSPE